MYQHYEWLIDLADTTDALWDIYNDVLISYIEGDLDEGDLVALELSLDDSHERMCA